MDNHFGGQDFACTGNYTVRSRDDPRLTDRRMQMMLTSLAENMVHFNVHQLSHILYCTVKLRLPEDRLINSSIEIIAQKLTTKQSEDEQMDMKDLALVVWACARIKMPKDSELPQKLKTRANNALKDCVLN